MAECPVVTILVWRFDSGIAARTLDLTERVLFAILLLWGGVWRPQDDCRQLPVSNAMKRQPNR